MIDRDSFQHVDDERLAVLDTKPEKGKVADDWEFLSEVYGVPVEEVGLIDFNHSGVYLPNNEVRENYRVRFKGTIMYPDGESWYALPVKNKSDTNFWIDNGFLYYSDEIVGEVGDLVLDTCDTSYQRGPNLLNLNSRSRSNCHGCRACVHNYKNLYDETVIRDQEQLLTKQDIEKFFATKESEGLRVADLQQIAVVTGLFGSEESAVEHLKSVAEVANPMGFKGELMYFGCEINSPQALDELAGLGDVSLVYALDNFTKRDLLLAKTKSRLSIEDAKRTMDLAKARGISTTFAYIAGIDPIEDLGRGFQYLRDSITRFPIINIYQVQTAGQTRIMEDQAKELEYYLQARSIIEYVLGDTGLRPQRWENYRPLWYKCFAGEPLVCKPYGD